MRVSANPFRQWIDLAQPRLGTRVIEVSDEFFGAVERLIQPQAPVFIAEKFDDHGKWMDGWESRRRRGPGHDYCVVRLGVAGVVRGIDLDTHFFTGNFPPEAELEACHCEDEVPGAGVHWRSLVRRSPLTGDSHNFFEIADREPVTHLRLNIYPDGGVARLRVYGEVRPDFRRSDRAQRIDLVALGNGGRALACSDEHYGSMHNLNLPGRGVNMGDGWETARRRGPGHDWVIVALGAPGSIEEIEIDTAHFKGNYPDRASLEGILLRQPPDSPEEIARLREGWQLVLAESRLEADSEHRFADAILAPGPFSHVRLNIYPDGGVSRLRLHGRVAGSESS